MHKAGAIILLAAATAHAKAYAEPAAITTINGAQETQINYDLSVYGSEFQANPTVMSIILAAASAIPTSALRAYGGTRTGYGYSDFLSFINEPTHTIDVPPFVTYIPESLRSKYVQLLTSYEKEILSIELSDARDTTGFPALSNAGGGRTTAPVTRTAAIPTMPSFRPASSGPSPTAAGASMSTSSSTGGASIPTARPFLAHAVGIAAGAVGAAAIFL